MADILENPMLRLELDQEAGGLTAVTNRLTGETYRVSGDTFSVETCEGISIQERMRRLEWRSDAATVSARYVDDLLEVEIAYEVHPAGHYFEKRLSVVFAADEAVRRITIGTPAFSASGLELACCRHPDFAWVTEYVHAKHGWELRRPEESEPTRTFFGRTGAGGFFTGLEMPYDASELTDGVVSLSYRPNLRVTAGERLAGERMYFGVYRRGVHDVRASEWRPLPAGRIVGDDARTGFDGAAAAGLPVAGDPARGGERDSGPAKHIVPLPSESAAMTMMTSSILGPPRHGVMAFACGWHSQMSQEAYGSDEELEGELRSLEFCAACGLDGVTDSHPWGGESGKMAALREGDRYVPEPRVRRFLEHARTLGLRIVQWPTMNNTHPWRTSGGPFRLDRPEWLRGVEGDALGGANADNFRRREANCLACTPFSEWLEGIILDDALGTGLYDGWCMDGDFWGTGAFFHTTIPVTCESDRHEHLPGDSNYACQRKLARLVAEVRRRFPGIYIGMCRPFMDLGVWAQRNVDACFTLIESGTGGSNLAAGDEVRTASRMRVHHHFLPHWLDWPLLFPSFAAGGSEWPSGHIDYLLLSALSCAPNLLLYLPTKTGIPDRDREEIRRWLEWGRRNDAFLLVRHDLFDWPGSGRVDGSAHLIGSRGFIFLFNTSAAEATAEFALTAESTGFTGSDRVEISEEYPAGDRRDAYAPGQTVVWPVPPRSALVLHVTEAGSVTDRGATPGRIA